MNKIRFGTVRLCAKHTQTGPLCSKNGWIHWLVICFNSPYEYYNGNETIKGKKNQCIIFPPYTPIHHGPDPDYGNTYDYNWIWMYGYGVYDLMEELQFPLCQPFSMGNENCVTPYLMQIINERATNSFYSEHFVSSLIYEMLVTLARNRKLAEISTGTYKSIETVHKFIRDNYDKKLTLQALSDISKYSVSRFCGLYKEIYNIAPIADLLNVRTENAKNLLTNTNYTISKISELCGFESIHYFSSKFKEITGMSPMQYRNEKPVV